MRTIEFPFQAIDTLTFNPRPQPLSASLRPVYRIALIALILKINCRGKTASMLKLQFFNLLLKNPSLQKSFKNVPNNQNIFTLEQIHLDPMVNLALKYAFADNLISVTKYSKYQLTDKGDKFADQILRNDRPVLAKERKLLEGIGQRISEVNLRKEML